MSEFNGISSVDRRQDTLRQYRAVHENVTETQTPQDQDLVAAGNGQNQSGGKGKRQRPSGDTETDGLSAPEQHSFDVTV